MRKTFEIVLSATALLLLFFYLFPDFAIQSSMVEKKLSIVKPCSPSSLSGLVDFSQSVAYFNGESLVVPKLALLADRFDVLGASSDERWIEVDLSDQKLYAWEGNNIFLETPVSTGLPWWPTPKGEFKIWIKLRSTKMEGGEGKYYYNLPNVPYVMYFENDQIPGWRGFGLHGAYWHNDFGTVHSHGCVNLPINIARELYYWVSPDFSDYKSVAYSSETNEGTKIIIHE